MSEPVANTTDTDDADTIIGNGEKENEGTSKREVNVLYWKEKGKEKAVVKEKWWKRRGDERESRGEIRKIKAKSYKYQIKEDRREKKKWQENGKASVK